MNDEDTHNTPSHTLSLTERQIDTIMSALKFDFKNAAKQFGALPISIALQEDIEDAYRAIEAQVSH